MTVLYRARRRWSKEEIAAIDAAAAQWKCENNGHESAPTTFTLSDGDRALSPSAEIWRRCVWRCAVVSRL